jgi:2-deoxy-D-gluconate 3-dehydrogenase
VPSKLFDLSGKRAVVVGGAGGIGSAIVDGFLEFGAKVVVIDLQKFDLKSSSFDYDSQVLSSVVADIAEKEQIVNSLESARSILGGNIDILVNSAGIQRRTPSEKFKSVDWDDVISVNLTSVFHFSQEVANQMIRVGRGKIINIASIMHQFGGRNIPAYSASKGGVVQLTRAMSNDLAGKGICVNAIAPGYISTPMNKEILEDDQRSKEILYRTPIGRWGVPDDLKGISIFLASRASDFVTGAVFPIDGGYSSR